MAHLTKHTFKFLKDLAANNNREWFNEHKDRYLTAHEEVLTFAQAVLDKLSEHDVLETPSGKRSMQRIYRDIRFSKDKTPYKDHFGGGFKRATAARRGGYYYGIEQSNVLIGGGFWGPNSADMKLIRSHMVVEGDDLKKVLNKPAFKAFFGNMEGEQLKNAPKGYSVDAPQIDLLRYKQYLIRHDYTKQEAMTEGFSDRVAEGLVKMIPFFDVFTEWLTTDLNGVSLLD